MTQRARDWSGLQHEVFAETKACGWDPTDMNSLTEELMHMVAELAEAFEHCRLSPDSTLITYEEDGKPRGVPVEFADVLIGLLFNAEREGFDLFTALEVKRAWNRARDYNAEGRQLHPVVQP